MDTNWRTLLIEENTPILSAIEIIDTGARQIALVTNDEGRLLGTVTDGDIRRGILSGKQLSDPVSSIMNQTPTVGSPTDTREKLLLIMKQKHFRQIPIVDKDRRVIHVETLDELLQPTQKENWVVLMAGGLGSRLSPLTDDCPKPLLMVGSKPLLETIMLNFVEQGFYNFYISVNYRSEMIKDFFGDGSRWGVNIRYIHELKRMGTAGSLTHLPKMSQPIIVMNGDLLTKVNFEQLLDFHSTHQSSATMCVREFDIQIPYGVVKFDKHRLIGIEEKPMINYYVNAGIYVLNPDVLQYIPDSAYFDMPDLFKILMEEEKQTSVFPIREYWLDIGRISDFEKANRDFLEVFG